MCANISEHSYFLVSGDRLVLRQVHVVLLAHVQHLHRAWQLLARRIFCQQHYYCCQLSCQPAWVGLKYMYHTNRWYQDHKPPAPIGYYSILYISSPNNCLSPLARMVRLAMVVVVDTADMFRYPLLLLPNDLCPLFRHNALLQFLLVASYAFPHLVPVRVKLHCVFTFQLYRNNSRNTYM